MLITVVRERLTACEALTAGYWQLGSSGRPPLAQGRLPACIGDHVPLAIDCVSRDQARFPLPLPTSGPPKCDCAPSGTASTPPCVSVLPQKIVPRKAADLGQDAEELLPSSRSTVAERQSECTHIRRCSFEYDIGFPQPRTGCLRTERSHHY